MDAFLEVFGDMTVATLVLIIAALVFVWKLYNIVKDHLIAKYKQELGNKLIDVVNALFAVLMILGIVNDPTTAGVGDSKQALTYEIPKAKEEV